MKIGNINNTMLFSFISVIYMIFFAIGFFMKKKVKSDELTIFKGLIFSNMISLIVEILLVVLILTDSILLKPFLKIFNICILLYVWIFGLYSYFTAGNHEKIEKNSMLFKIYVIFFVICSAFILILPVNINLLDYKQYSFGPSVNFLFVSIFIIVLLTIFLLVKNLKQLRLKKCTPIVLFLLLIFINAVIQYIWPAMLLANSFFSFITFFMYFTIENPDKKLLDEVHRAKEITDNANEEKAMFLYNMTNELREITKDIDYDADNILNETDNKKIDREVINNSAREIKASTARFTTMTNEILDVSQIDSANIKIYNDKYNLKLVVKELVQIYKKKAEKKSLEFRTNIDSDLPEYLYGDIIGLKTSLNVILDNSVKYTEKGYIDFSVSSIMKNDIARLIIAVEDSGTGMKAEELTKIFNKQESSKDSLNLSNNLNNAKKLITLMGGTIIPSSVYGKGTVMKVILDQKVAESDGTLTKYESLYDKKKVLLVDDSEASIKIISKHIKDSNIILDVVTSGKECLDKIREKEKFDLILMDEEMEPLDGITVMKKLLDIRTFNIPVILLTKNNDYEYNEEYLKYGFKDYILKPTQKEDFFNKIDKYLK